MKSPFPRYTVKSRKINSKVSGPCGSRECHPRFLHASQRFPHDGEKTCDFPWIFDRFSYFHEYCSYILIIIGRLCRIPHKGKEGRDRVNSMVTILGRLVGIPEG